jgi:glyoxylate/hydroxypyruvate reductase A
MTTLLLHLSDVDEPGWTERYRAALPEVRVVRRGDDYDPARVDYAFVWKPTPEAFDGLTGLKAVLSLGAGVDALLKHPRLPAVPSSASSMPI